MAYNPPSQYHTADYNQDWRIDTDELNRVTDLYNASYLAVRTGAYKVDGATVDGFDLDETRPALPAVSLEHYHSADYAQGPGVKPLRAGSVSSGLA